MSVLDKHPLLASKDLCELREVLAEKNAIQNVDTVGKQSDIDVEICGVFFDDMPMANFKCSGAMTKYVTREGPDVLQLIVTSSGAGQTECGNETYVMKRDVGYIRNMGVEHVSYVENVESLGLFLPIERIKDHARHVLGEGADKIDPQFETNFDMTTPGGEIIRRSMSFVANAMNDQRSQGQHKIIMKSMSDLLLTQVLTLIPNSYSALLDGANTSQILPRHLKRARDFIHANAKSAITLEDIATHAGCGYRTLQMAFKDALSMSPMAYVMHVRLSFAHEDLLSADNTTSIRDIAMKWGFPNVRWFSKKHKERFGVSPSQVLRKGS